MADKIQHEGVVLSAEAGVARVRILQASACSQCKAHSMCMSAEAKEKMIDCEMVEPLAVGDKVMVEVEERQGWFAILLAFVLPFLLVMGLIYGLGKVMAEEWAGTLALCSLVPYYGVLSLFRNKLKKHFSFIARKI